MEIVNNAFIRQLQIDLITGEHNPIINWFNNTLSNIGIINFDHNNERGSIYYEINNHEKYTHHSVMFFKDDISKKLWCNYNRLLKMIPVSSETSFLDITLIIDYLLENNSTITEGYAIRMIPFLKTIVLASILNDTLK